MHVHTDALRVSDAGVFDTQYCWMPEYGVQRDRR